MARKQPARRGVMPLSELLTEKETKALASFDVREIDALLRFAPRRYVVPGPLTSLYDAEVGDDISAVVTVQDIHERTMRNRPGTLLEVDVTDGTATVTLTFFLGKRHLSGWHRSRLPRGARIVVHGTVGEGYRGGRQIVHPDYEQVEDTEEGLAWAQRPRPIYPLRKNISQATMRSATQKGLEFADTAERILPEEVLAHRGLPTLAEAARLLHTPLTLGEARRGMTHLRFEEAFVLQAIFAQRRAQDLRTPAPELRAEGPLQPLFDERLPFTLTEGQHEIGEQLASRIGNGHPTSALLQGDVGSGKTVIALRAMLRAVDSGHQAVLLAPTEVLAEQHHRTIVGLLGDLAGAGHLDGHPDATRVRLLTGSQRTTARRETLLDVTSGAAGIVVGTHALLTESVEFASLGLVVIDEQHRFGVDHRRRLRAKGPGGMSPHVVVMTATPIPRTAALATVGDLDVLTLRESPGRRGGVTSFVVHERLARWEERMWQRAGEEIAAGRQVFVVCARIDEGEADAPAPKELDEYGREKPDPGLAPARGVTQTAERLATRPELAGARIGVLHGRLTTEEKQEVMAEMAAGEIDVLVSTTVIEVGVDVPNASVMIVLDAERFGVSQLHQLRGRVGRGEHPGIAFFDTSAEPGEAHSTHLQAIADTSDGFLLAELDLRRRGAGDLVGEEQSGLQSTVKHLDLLRDSRLIEAAREVAFAVVKGDPDLEEHTQLAGAIALRLRDADPDVERS
ncbi:ATP-dependent DNA helicase RecG [Brachybacterium aquaticum]|uniref:Probable DNA 3'-5' helicase RecG n=1 Tax=Brachybacterium aquaticum TaxID=1432564 RepID=A0A841AD24_9MICO|nr:ATP-dependent DNA helicase RecG [Brachybacterium aquaticum]MBB5831182.1 ATP-dependent DNA helicase RecG [Brachybacterium aquaticum]